MSGILVPLLIFAMLATLGVLFFGIATMARGGDFNKKNANKLMRARVAMQAVAVGLFAIVLLLIGKG